MTLKAITASTTYSIVCTWPGVSTFSVVWQAPLQNNDGTPYSNPGGFRILYGRTAADLDQSAYIQDPAARSWTSPAGLAAGNWYVGVRAFNTLGLESPTELSTLNPKTISAGVTQTRSMGIVVTVPKPPTGVN